MADFLGFLIIIGIVFCIGYVWNWLTKPRFNRGEINADSLKFGPYSYIIGDNIFNPARGHGIQVILPKYLPEIFIDSHNDGRSELPINYILSGQQLSLEGDFNTYFQVFCAPEAANMALTILTPDVMAVLIDASENFDVRIAGKTLQIFSNSKIYRDKDEQAVLLRVAQQLIAEIDHKMKSFKDSPSNAIKLKVQTEQAGVKFGKRYFRSASVTFVVTTALFASIFYLISVWAYFTPVQKAGNIDQLFFWLGFSIFPCLALVLVLANRAQLLTREFTLKPKVKRVVETTGNVINILVIIVLALIALYVVSTN